MHGVMMVAIATILLFPAAAEAATSVKGRWVTEAGTAVVEIEPCARALCGRVLRVLQAAAHEPKTDVNNPDPAMRGHPIVGLTVLYGFVAKGDEWRGRIYSPKEGQHYRSTMRMNSDGTLRIRGCLAMFCKTQTWRPLP